MKRCAAASLAVVAAFFAVSGAIAASMSTDTIEKCWKPGMSHDASVTCEFDAAKETEKQLDEAYNTLYVEARKMAADNPALKERDLEGALHKSEAAFKSFIAAQCSYETQLYTGTKSAADADALCRIRLVDQQLKTLAPSKQAKN